jgi:DNA-binding transcriptional LysR family regulator
MVNLDRMQAFVAVAEAGSFTAAAEQLGMTKSAVSQAISQLEKELGAQLIQRSTRSLNITDVGLGFLADCRALLDQANEVVERARGSKAQIAGLLRITSSADSAPFVAPLVAEYLAQYPEMRVEYLPTDRIIDLVKERVDLSLRVTGLRDSSLHAVGLAEMNLWCLASPEYLKARGKPKTPEELADHDWIAFSTLPSPWTREFRVRNGRKVTIRIKGRVSASSAFGVRALALAGAGVFTSPSFMVRADVASGRLIHLVPDTRQPPIYLYAAWPDRIEPPAKTRAFIELAKARLRGAEL